MAKARSFPTRAAVYTGAVCAALFTAAVLAQSTGLYPTKALTLMVSYDPAGATDYQARLAVMMSEKENYLGQPVVVTNKPGKGGQTGWDWFVQTAPHDGYTMAVYNVPHFIAQSIMFDTKYNVSNLEPIANWGADPAVLIVSKKSPYKTVADLVAFAKANPGKTTISGGGTFTGHHIAMLQLEKAAGIKLKYVTTNGGRPAMDAVVSGAVIAGFNNTSDVYRNQDKVNILAIADLVRDKVFLPNVPTLKETGYDVDDTSVNVRGIMANSAVPPEVIGYLTQRVPLMFGDATVGEKMRAGGAGVRVMTRDQVKRMWGEREKTLGILLADLKAEALLKKAEAAKKAEVPSKKL
jgi:tripartite-type tricarboxylate transporter receptor subunit TctC